MLQRTDMLYWSWFFSAS